MSARFGPAGNSESFSKDHKSSLAAPGWIAGLGLDCYEYQCGKGVHVGEETGFTYDTEKLPYLPVYPYANIIYSIHTYMPGFITHQLNRDSASFLPYPCPERKIDKNYLRRWLEPVRRFQLLTGARIYVGEFGCLRWVPGADQYIKDNIDLCEEYGWDWNYHAFREFDGWSVEHSENPHDMKRYPDTKRKRILLEGFRKNRSGTP